VGRPVLTRSFLQQKRDEGDEEGKRLTQGFRKMSSAWNA
jgi:hypothetical protein